GAAVGAGAGARSATANPRVDERVGDVHEHVDDDVEDGDDDDAADHHRQVVVLHTLHDHAAHPGEVEQPLHHHGPADEAPEADAGEGDDRDRGGPERLGHQDVPGGHALGPRGEDEVLLQGGDHVAAQHA